MQPVGVLGGRHRRDGLVRVQALGQGQLDENAVDRGIGVQAADEIEQLGA